MFRTKSQEEIYNLEKELDSFISSLNEESERAQTQVAQVEVAENKKELPALNPDIITEIKRIPIQKLKKELLKEIIDNKNLKEQKLHSKYISTKIFEDVNAGRISNALKALKTVPNDMQKYVAFTSNLTSTCFSADFFFKAGFRKEALEISNYIFKKSLTNKYVETSGNILIISKKHDFKLKTPITDYMLNVYHWLITNNQDFLKEYFECSTLLRFDNYIAKKQYLQAAEILSCYKLDDQFYTICKKELNDQVFQEVSKFFTST